MIKWFEKVMKIYGINSNFLFFSSNKGFGCITDRCSPRCKLGLLGFIIEFLTVEIAFAVFFVL
jgi:hypothetical protein